MSARLGAAGEKKIGNDFLASISAPLLEQSCANKNCLINLRNRSFLPLVQPNTGRHLLAQGRWAKFTVVFVKRKIELEFSQFEQRTHWTSATPPPFGPMEGQKWFDQISSQWESQKNRLAFISFGKSRFNPPTIWDQLFMTTVSAYMLS